MINQTSNDFQYVHLNSQFYFDYADCSEIMKDPNRQYLHLVTKYEGNTFMIPFRSEMNHNTGFKFGDGLKGLDFSKSVIINDFEKYAVLSQKPIPQYQHNLIVKNIEKIRRDFHRLVKTYCTAIQKNDMRVLKRINSNYNTLQYFHKELGLNK